MVSYLEYVPCNFCYGYYCKTDLWKHECSCKPDVQENTKGQKKRRRVVTNARLLLPAPKFSSSAVNTIISSMRVDEITLAIRNDRLALELAQKMFKKFGHNKDQHAYIRTTLRLLGRLLLKTRENTDMRSESLEDFIDPKYFRMIVEAAKYVAGFNEEKSEFGKPSTALKIGHAIKKCAIILKSRTIEEDDDDLKRKTEAFLELCEINWVHELSTSALRNLNERKRKNPTVLPLTEDIVKMTEYLKNTGRNLFSILKEDSNITKEEIIKAWKELNEILLSRIIVFNRRRSGEVSRMKLSDYIERPTSNETVTDCSLSEIEKALCRILIRVEIEGKRGRTVPVILNNEMKEWLELLILKREDVGVNLVNEYLFPVSTYGGEGHIRGSDCVRKHAVSCNARYPENLRSTKLRKHIATTSQVLNLKENELDVLAKFMGHDLHIHRNFYRLPEKTLEVAKVTKVLLSLESGSLSSNAGKNLDNMDMSLNDGRSIRVWLKLSNSLEITG